MMHRYVVWICAALILGYVLGYSLTAQGQSDQTMLARAAVAECGWTSRDCHAAVWYAVQYRAQRTGRTIPEQIRAYCAAWKIGTRARSVWVRELSEVRPQHWPGEVRWDRHVRFWRRIYRRTGAFLRGKIRNPCNGRPMHFGGNYGIDKRRAVKAGWKVLRCGKTGMQNFYTL